jgi:DNA-binding PadR family transcriptional regulator
MERKLLLLGLLRQHQMHGYQLFEFIEKSLATCTDLKKPTAYYLLNKMAEDGWISEAEMQAGHRPPRRVYSLTARGQEEFERLLRLNLAGPEPAYLTGDTGLAFLDSLAPPEAAGLLRQRRAQLAGSLADVQAAPRHQGSLQLVIDHRVRHLQAEIAWLDEIIHGLENKPAAPFSNPASAAQAGEPTALA